MVGRLCGGWGRASVLLVALALFTAPAMSLAHAIEHHGAVDSADCGTCRWSKNSAGLVVDTPSLGFAVTVEVACPSEPAVPQVQLGVLAVHTRGPPPPHT